MTSARPDQDCYCCRVSAGLTDPFIFENRSLLGIFDAIHGVRQVIETTDMNDLYRNMLNRDYLQERPKGFIETVLRLPYLGKRPDAYTVGNNDGRAAGRSIDHLHIIVLPRYKGDVEDPRGGIRNIIPQEVALV